MSQIDLFSMLGISTEEEEKPKKKAAQKTEAKKSEKKPAEEKNKLTSPLTVYIGSLTEALTLTMDGEIKEADVLAFAQAHYPSYAADITTMKRLKGNAVHVCVQGGMAKGSITVKEGARCFVGCIEVGLENIEATLDLTKLTETIKESLPLAGGFSFKYSEKENMIFAYPEGKAETTIKGLSKIQLHTEDGNCQECDIWAAEKEGQMAMSLAEDDPDSKKDTPVDTKKWIGVPDSPLDYELFEMEEKGHYFVYVKGGTIPAPASKKDTTYPVDGVELSLLFKSYQLSSEMFKGKNSATKTEIMDFLVSQGHREFLFMDNNLVTLKYNEKNKILLVVVRGSTKGCTAEISLPAQVLYDWEEFSKTVWNLNRTEALMDLYYDSDTQEYLWYVPDQVVAPATVHAEFEPFLQAESLCGLKKVGQFHSHGGIQAFFSATDNRDEQYPGIYGVIGSLSNQNPTYAFRVVKDGESTSVRMNAVGTHTLGSNIYGWISRVHPEGERRKADALYPVVYFANGTKGLLLSCGAEAQFARSIRGFQVKEYKSSKKEDHILINEAEKDLREPYFISSQKMSMFDLF